MSNILVTGAAGFIGSAVCRKLLENGENVTGLDSINSYYNVDLKYARLEQLGIERTDIDWDKAVISSRFDNFVFIRLAIEDTTGMERLFDKNQFDVVINLAAQAGVRYSIENPGIYVKSNIDGFLNILEGCRRTRVKHLVFASSSSIYGLNAKVPFSEHDSAEHPVSLYAATKKSNEMMAHAYSHLYGIPTTGLRFFTVYGPWGRPDMSPYLFIDAILHDRPIKVFNYGDMYRDFTYIDDIVEGVTRIINVIPEGNSQWDAAHPDPASSSAPYRIFNIGNQRPTCLRDYIANIEKCIGKEAVKEYLPMQPGDVYQTFADSSELHKVTGFVPDTSLEDGISKTIEWFKAYHNL